MGSRLNRENLAVGHLGNASFNEPLSAEATELSLGRYDGVLPSKTPYLVALEDGTDRYEVVKVLKIGPGPVLVMTRGQEGTEAVEHPTPCTFNFGISNQELADLVGALVKK